MTAPNFLIGGIVPAICLGLGTVLMSTSIGAGAPIPIYLASVGTVIALIGWHRSAPLPFSHGDVSVCSCPGAGRMIGRGREPLARARASVR